MLAPGRRLGPYEIVSPLGAGGMGEVYRARDTTLDRDVAIKILPELFAADPERLGRFEREARTLASLNHPHIAQIYGLEQSGTTSALVMELVEGEDLAQRIARGPIPVDEALAIGKQIANALEGAHEQGIVHRDLKPANIKLRPDGTVKVLDFGLAKAAASETGDVATSPTFTVAATQMGVIVGTAAYMAPEQARGKMVDKRADIWAFGCVLYEMLAGRRAFDGEDAGEILAAVIRGEPDWTGLPSSTPPYLRRLIERCLRKDPRTRLRDIGDALQDLEEPPHAPSSAGGSATHGAAPPARRAALAGWATAGLLAAGAGAIAFVHFREPAPAPPPVVRFAIPPPDRARFADALPIVSPDGRRVAVQVRGDDGRTTIWIRALDALDARPLTGTERPRGFMFWSPDSRHVAFVAAADQRLKKVDVSGGPPETICEVTRAYRGGAWSPRGVIVFAAETGLMQVPAAGGTPTPLTTSVPGEFHGWPMFLPDGRRFLYLRGSEAPGGFSADVHVGSLDGGPDRQDPKRLLAVQSLVWYVPVPGQATGYLLFDRDARLMAQAFDVERLETKGDPFALPERVADGRPSYSVSPAGVLAFHGPHAPEDSHLLWFDATGKMLGQVGPPARYGDVMVTRDGTMLAIDQTDPQTRQIHIWTVDVRRGVFSRLNPGSPHDMAPAVARDGRVAFTAGATAAQGDLYVRPASGVGEPELLVKSETIKHANDWSPDARFLLYDDHHPKHRQDLWVLPMAGDRKPIALLTTPADETAAVFSPDGRWFAYASDEAGRREIYVRDFAPDRVPATGSGKWQISIAGGDKPRWSRDGTQLYYIAPDRKLMMVPVRTAPTFEPGRPVPLFDTNVTGFFPYDVAPDGRFLMNTVPDPATLPSPPITVVLNWAASLTTTR